MTSWRRATSAARRLLPSPERSRRIFTLGLPIIGGMISQNVVNLVDTAMVGTLGDDALAAVGMGSFASFMAMALVMGFSAGVQAMAARRVGEGRSSETAHALNAAVLLVIAIAVPLSTVLFLLAPLFTPLLNPSPAVVDAATPYLQARIVGMVAVGVNFAFRGYWNGVSRPALYMRTLVLIHATNIFLNWVLIFGNLGFPAYGPTGAGIASTVATYVGALYYLYLGWRHARAGGFLSGLADRETVRTILRLAIPDGFRMVVFAAGFVALYIILGQISTAATSAANVLINIMLVAILPSIALGMAAATLTGESLGRQQPEEAKRWGWDVARLASVTLAGLGLPMVLFPDLILSAFLHVPSTRALAAVPLQLFGAGIGVEAGGMVLMNALLGAGASRQVMAITASLQWGLFLPAAYLIGPVLGWGLVGVWVAQLGYRALQTGVIVLVWRRGAWARIEV